MTSKSKSKQEEALQFLDDLDSLNTSASASKGGTKSVPKAPTVGGQPPANEAEAAEALAFLDEITQKSSEPTRTTTPAHLEKPNSRAGTPSLRKSTERVKVGGGSVSPLLPSASSTSISTKTESPAVNQVQSGGSWGWGSVWTSASAAIQQAKTVVDEQVKNLPKNEQAKKWSEGMMEYAKSVQVEKLGADFKRVGLSTLTDILNVVAPPISEHEVIQVWLSHDMKGYDGVETLVYRALARIMEQVEGGDLIVNRGEESRPKDGPSDSQREMNAVEGYEAAYKLAQAELDQIIKSNARPPPVQDPTNQSPTTYSHVYLRIQPYITSYTLPQQADPTSESVSAGETATAETQSNLQFILHLSDPWHQLVHTTVTQAVPGDWLEIWDEYDWVEDLVVEALRVGVEVVGQEYIVARMGWGKKGKGKDKVAADEPVVIEKPTETS